MDSFSNKYKILLLLVLLLPVFFLFKNAELKERFRFNPRGDILYSVKEQGTLIYPGKNPILFENNYKLKGKMRLFGKKLEIKGVIKGEIDKKIKQLFSSDSFDLKLDLYSTKGFCPQTVSGLYPASLRRLFYFVPKGYLFKGKKWVGSFCNGNISCHYIVNRFGDKTVDIGLQCDGNYLNQDIIMTGEATLDRKSSLFSKLSSDIGVASKRFHSQWKFHETADSSVD